MLKNGHTLVTNQPNALAQENFPIINFSFWIEKMNPDIEESTGCWGKVHVKQWTI